MAHGTSQRRAAATKQPGNRRAADRGRCARACRRSACRRGVPARLLAEAAAADPQCLPRIRVADRSPRTSPAWPARRPRCRASSRTTAPGSLDAAPRPVRGGRVPRQCRTRTGRCWCRTSTSGTPTSPRCCRPSLSCRAGASTTSWCRSPRRAARSARTSTSTTCSCCRRRAIAAGRSMRQVRGSPPLAFRNDVELKLLREFKPTHEWVLGPGDMLYLPPGVPHHGVARGCLPDLLRRHARAVGRGTARRFRRHPRGRCRRGPALPRSRPGAADGRQRDRRGAP